MMTITDQLTSLGLTGRESALYLQLLKSGSSSPAELADQLHIPRPNVYDIAKQLAQHGLIHYQIANKKRLLVAEGPEKLEELMRQKLSVAKSLLPILKELAETDSFRSKISFYEGRKAMQNLCFDGLSCQSKEIWYLWPPKDMDKILGKKLIERFITERLKRHISIRSLRPAEKESLYAKESDTILGRQLTEVAYVPEQHTFALALAIYDQKVAFFSSQKESFGFLVESREFTQVMRMFYQTLWQNSGKLK